MSDSLYKLVRSAKYLRRRAWPAVRHKAEQSRSPDTQREIHVFSQHVDRNLESIYRHLQRGIFTFGPAKGVPIRKRSGGRRPLVIPSIPSRIVQRSILEVLHDVPEVDTAIRQEGSYGGVRDGGVPRAIEAACKAIAGGATSYIRSDIRGFFTRIPRQEVLRKLNAMLPDDSLEELLEGGTRVELENLAELGELASLYPDRHEGVAQGSCLSPLLGNLLLADLDRSMNHDSIRTIRYIDDILILGPDKKSVEQAFRTARRSLQELGLDAYEPGGESQKASAGPTSSAFEFLGCSISPHFVQPSKTARATFFEKVERELHNSISHLWSEEFGEADSYDLSLLATLETVSRMIRAWANHYKFCNGLQAFAVFDRKVDSLLARYLSAYSRKRKKLDSTQQRRLLGVWLAMDGKREPILPLPDATARESR